MRGLALGLSLSVAGIAVAVGCSTASGPKGRNPGSAGTGSSANGGRDGTAGTFAAAGNGISLDVDAAMEVDAGSDAAVDAGICDNQTIQTTEAVPTVLLLVDTSGSMFEPRTLLWEPLFNALMDPTKGVVASLQSKVRFGFTSYKSITRPVNTAACPELLSTDLKINNFDTIKTAYASAGVTPTTDFKWETPTGASVAAAAKALAAFKPDPPGPKFILLVTDGDPDTCAVRDPQCGQDDSIKALQDAHAAGIGTFVIGIGDILNSNSASMGMRVGREHLQDIANAGAGQPVAANTEQYKYQQCVTAGLTASYAAVGQTPGTTPFFTVSAADGITAQTQLSAAILASLAQTRSCSFNMDARVNGDASLGTLTVNGQALPFGDANGWQLGADLISVTLNGSACESWKKDGGNLNVVFPCKLVPVEHVDRPPLK